MHTFVATSYIWRQRTVAGSLLLHLLSPHRNAGVTDVCYCAWIFFLWFLELRAQVLILMCQVLPKLSHLPSSSCAFEVCVMPRHWHGGGEI